MKDESKNPETLKSEALKTEALKQETLDSAIDSLRNDLPSDNDITAAAERVRAAIAVQRRPIRFVREGVVEMGDVEAGVTEESVINKNVAATADSELEPASITSDHWNSIDDYIAAIPAYLAGELSAARTTLLEEEARQSIPLRRALNKARGFSQPAEQLQAVNDEGSHRTRWFAAAATVAAMAVALFFALPELPSLDQTQLAQIEEVDGQLYKIVDGHLESLVPGTWIEGHQRIRSAGNTKAVIVLDDGSRIEVDERSELSMVRRGAGNRIDVSRGRILVVASPQGSGTLDVYTDEFEVSVTGTIFEVAHGAKGSRVAVIEGSVNVELQGNTTSLEPGEVMGSRASEYNALSLVDELAWSKDADQYIAMLQELATLSEDLEAVMQIEPRYSTRLLDLVPVDTAVYAAVPNAATRVADVYEVIQLRMRESSALAEVWAGYEASVESHYVDVTMAFLREIGNSFGEETVFAITASSAVIDGAVKINAIPVVLSEVDAASFVASFDYHVAQIREVLVAEGHQEELDALEIALITDPAEAVAGQLSILLYEDILVATIDPATIQTMYDNLVAGSSDFAATELHAILQANYAQGTEILGAVDLAALIPDVDEPEVQAGLEAFGVANAGYLIAQIQQQNGSAAIITADLYFNGEREGVMGWLATPGPMGSLEFFSTNTTLVAAMLLQEPAAMLDEFERIAASSLSEVPEASEFQAELDLFYDTVGILGGEMAIGLDGPALPSPAWKVVIEAFDATAMQENIEWTVARANEAAAAEGIDGAISLVSANVAGYSGYRVDLELSGELAGELGTASVSFNYAYVDGYIVAGPNRGLVERAVNYYESGSGLQTSSEYRELMLRDGYLDFSAVYFSRLGQLINDVMGNLPANITPEQQQAISSLDVEIGPSMSSILALPDKMHFAHSGSTQLPAQILSRLAMLQPVLAEMADGLDAQQQTN